MSMIRWILSAYLERNVENSRVQLEPVSMLTKMGKLRWFVNVKRKDGIERISRRTWS